MAKELILLRGQGNTKRAAGGEVLQERHIKVHREREGGQLVGQGLRSALGKAFQKRQLIFVIKKELTTSKECCLGKGSQVKVMMHTKAWNSS